MDKKFHGLYVILPTPFDDQGGMDEAGLRRVVSFSIDCGADGLVSPANASEAPYLSDAERRQVVETVIGETAGRVPVVAGVTASCAPLAVEFARHAQQAGADYLMAMPPFVQRASDAEIRAYYARIHDATTLPIVIQNYGGPGGTPMSAPFLAQLLRDFERVRFVKEETEFSGMMITAVIEAAGAALEGVMGGKAGRHLPEEHRRGVCGTMPACEVADIHSRLWQALDAGRDDEATETYRLLLPLLLFETSYGVAVYKEVLRRRGVIGSAYHRQSGGRVLDAGATEELGRILAPLRPMMSRQYPLNG